MRNELTLLDAALVNSALRWETHAQLCQRWLLEGNLDTTNRLAYSRDVARASSERDKCIRALGLKSGGRGRDSWSTVDCLPDPDAQDAVSRVPVPPSDSEPIEPPDDIPATKSNKETPP